MFVKIILTENNKAIDMAFTYSVPEGMQISVGQKVIVPFGQGNRLVEGFVLEHEPQSHMAHVKEVFQVVEGFALTPDQTRLIQWLRETYLCTYSEAVTTIVPSGTKLIRTDTFDCPSFEPKSKKQEALLTLLENSKSAEDLDALGLLNIAKSLVKKGQIRYRVHFTQEVKTLYKKVALIKSGATIDQVSSRAKKQRQVLEFLMDVQICDVSVLNRELKCTKQMLDNLVALDLVEVLEVEINRRPDQLKRIVHKVLHPLSPAQGQVYEAVNELRDVHHKFLLHGVTGSGKTEIYMTLAEQVVRSGRQVIILVPEIALTPQIVGKFLKRFGPQIAVIHSKVSPGERFDQYNAIQSGQAKIIIGARSAVFSPCKDLGLIIMDEEHENTYKSEQNPKYVTKEVAAYLTEKAGVPLVLASATPSVETYYQTRSDYTLLELSQRYNAAEMPSVYLVDMREELKNGNRTMFSELLVEKMRERLAKKEQTILFYNRKGYATFVSCRSCGYALKCPRCDIALTYHQREHEAKCSYCDYKIRVPKTCPECESTYFKFFGAGTEKIESMLQEILPEARIGRLDSESTARKGSLEKIIEAVEKHEIDILLGTQMVTKGLDFKNVTLVGALSADMSLNMPDYRAPEKTFQLLTQVAGRAGRGDKHGEVVVQSYTPEHYAIQAAMAHDYQSFYETELQVRELFSYPPYVDMISLLISSENDEHVIRSAHNLHHELLRFIHKRIKPEDIEILGPNPAIFQKINNRYRWQIILKFDKIDLVLLRNIINYVCITHRDKVVMNDVYININIKPLSLM